MTLMSSISALTTSVDQLTAEVNVSKATLDAKVAQAAAEVVSAQAEQALAEGYRATTATHAADAATHLATVKAGVTYQGIAAILASKAVTAVDVFVYDTSKDSDGGAWRKRCQHTSWYNETLNTATRGSRREFPAVAVIVAEASKLTIYDGDDPSLPMWMVFNTGVASYIYQANISSAAMLNGRLAVGQNLTAGISLTDFVADKNICSLGHASANYVVVTPISTRNGGTRILTADILIASGVVNDVAMTVLPDAPVDPATGLPVPTIAVATAAGVSVIRDDLIVVDSASTLNSHQVLPVAEGLWYGGNSGLQLHFATWGDIRAGDGFGDQVADNTAGGNRFDLQARVFHGLVAAKGALAWGTNSGASGTAFPGLQLRAVNFPDQLKGMSAFLTSEFNTGWLPGDIKGAFLSSTDTASLVGSGELVTNGTFDTDVSGWNAIDATTSVTSGVVRVTTTAAYGRISQVVPTVAGKTYCVTADLIGGTAATATILTGGTYTSKAVGSQLVHYFTATGGNVTLSAQVQSTVVGQYVDFDNISVKLADADRSANAKGLIVNGTITRSPVADGAELVAYSGFSAANYLEQPYNSALDFGTGDFCVMGWVYNETWPNNANPTPLYRGDDFYGTGNGIFVQISSGKPNVFLGRSASKETILANSTLPNAAWSHVVLVRSGSTVSWYINGKLDASGTSSRDLSNSNAKLWVGVWNNSGAPIAGATNSKYALLRISATAPTPDQIKKIYEDERKLFQPGAQCTLYGTSDAVTALAHDPKTNLLHVGTSAGRSTFDGLVRVANTTTPVATAISAVNGLIAEQ